MRGGLTLVLGGGGARGAMQVGAIRALIEAGFKPDLLVGSSVGAVNSAGLGIWGVNLEGIASLETAYQNVQKAHLMEPRLSHLALRTLTGRLSQHATQRVRQFFIEAGITPDLRFKDIKHISLGLVSSNLDTGKPVIYGQDPEQFILDGVMASIALPPWFSPVEQDGHVIVDGGALSNLPIEPALRMGATQIIAMDLNDPETLPQTDHGVSHFLEKLTYAVTQREVDLEMELAAAQNVPLYYLRLKSSPPVPIWDFSNVNDLIEIGYNITREQLSDWYKDSQMDLLKPPGSELDNYIIIQP